MRTQAFIKSSLARGLVPLYTSTLLAGGWAMILPIIPELTDRFGVSAGAAAQVVTAFALGRFIGTPLSGVVLDEIGTRGALLLGPLVVAAAALLAAVSPWFGLILFFLAVMGAGDTLWTMGREVAGIDLARPDQRGRVLSGFHGVHNIGLALGPLAGGLLTEAASFRAVFAAYGACAALSLLLASFARAPEQAGTRVIFRRRRAGARSPLAWLRALPGLFREIAPELRPTYAALVLATVTSFVHRSTTQSMLPLYAGSYLGFAPSQVGLLFTISGAFVFAMIVPAGLVIDKVGRKWATVPSTGIPALAFVFIPFSHSFAELAVLVSLLGVANGLSLGSLATSTYDVVPPSARGRLQAARRTIAEVGGTLAPLAGGVLADRFNPGAPFLAYAPLLVVSALLLALVGKETLERREP